MSHLPRNSLAAVAAAVMCLMPLGIHADGIDFGIGPFQFSFGTPSYSYGYSRVVVPAPRPVLDITSYNEAICYAITNHKYLVMEMEQKVDTGKGVFEYRIVRQVVAPLIYGVDEKGQPVLRGVRVRPAEEVASEVPPQSENKDQDGDAATKAEGVLTYQEQDGKQTTVMASNIIGIRVLEDTYFEPSSSTVVDDSGMKIVNCKIK